MITRNLDSLTNRLTPYATLPLRIGVGAIFLYHGWGKWLRGLDAVAGYLDGLGFPIPTLMAVLLIGTELIGGGAILIGLFTRYFAVPGAIIMAVAIFTAHADDPFGVWEKPLLILLANLALIILGAGRLSVDHFLRKWDKFWV